MYFHLGSTKTVVEGCGMVVLCIAHLMAFSMSELSYSGLACELPCHGAEKAL